MAAQRAKPAGGKAWAEPMGNFVALRLFKG